MLAWILYYKESAIYNQKYISFYIEEGRRLDIDIRLILVEDIKFGVKSSRWFIKYKGREISPPGFVISRVVYPLLSRQMELMGIKVFNNSFVSEICNNKAKTYQYLAKTGIQMIDSYFYKSSQGREAILRADGPTVLKAVDGHGGKQVFLYDPIMHHNKLYDYDDYILDGLGNSDLIVQPFTGSRHQDLRIYVIGREIIAGILRTAKNGFKSNYSLGGDVRLYQLSIEEKHIANTIINQFDFGLVGIDFLIGTDGKLIFNEIEDVVGSRMLYQCSDINIVKRYLEYIIKKINSLDSTIIT
jgi:gamma-F420-2:alpha-L-glutamate ligase